MPIATAIHDMLVLQGEIKIKLFLAAIPEGRADDLAAEILDVIATSDVASAEHRAAYEALNAGREPMVP